MNDTLLKFEALKLEETRIAEELEKIKPEVTAILNDLFEKKGKEPKIETENGAITRHPVSKWTFPPSITDMEERVKSMKDDAKKTGEAQVEINYSCKYTIKK